MLMFCDNINTNRLCMSSDLNNYILLKKFSVINSIDEKLIVLFIVWLSQYHEYKELKKHSFTLITFASHPSLLTSSVTIACKPVTISGLETVFAANACTAVTVIALLTHYNIILTIDIRMTNMLSCYDFYRKEYQNKYH